jgi:PAS domain S-box-containing protein
MEGLVAGDHIVRLAAHALRAPVALLALLADDGMATVAAVGLAAEAVRQAGVRADDVVAITEAVIVPDVAVDPRFAESAWARLARGRQGSNDANGSAALAPVRDAVGRPIGVVAVLAGAPRAWTPADADALTDLAALVASGVEARRSHALEAQKAELSRAVQCERQRADLYRLAARNFPRTGLMVFDTDLRFVLAEGQNLSSLAPRDVVGKTIPELFPPEHARELEARYRSVLAGNTLSVERIFEGRKLILDLIPLRASDGEVTAGMIVARDVTDHVIAEEARRQSEARYRLLFERAGKAFLFLQADGEAVGRILEVNATAAEMHGYTVEEMLRLHITDLLTPSQVPSTLEGMSRALHEGWASGRSTHLRKDGTVFLAESSGQTLEIGGRRLLFVITRDITQQQREAEELRQAKDAAEAASRAKSAFLANMSHEIRTPMSAILGYTQLLQRDPWLQRRQQQHLDVIGRSGEHLLSLINDVLEMSKIEAGHRRLVRDSFDLWGMMDDIERMFRLRAIEKRLRFEVQRSTSVPRNLVSDEVKLRQVIVNLLGNAVKFTEQGGVTVHIFALRADEGEQRLIVEVKDTGPGISDDEVIELFQPFAQARVGIQARGGTGLGLALSREFARLMGGDITVQSRLGHGSIFRLEIPIELTSAKIPVRAPPRSGKVMAIAGRDRPVRVIVVDDNDDNRSWLRQLLSQIGFDVREATNGAEAVSLFEQWTPHVVLMDMNMPVLDGYAAMRAIRTLPKGRGATLIAVTASAFDEERTAIVAAGADGWVRKPCNESDLLEEIRAHLDIQYRYLDASQRSSPSLHAPPPSPVDAQIGLPTGLAERLQGAARIADFEHLTELIGTIPPEHARVADELQRLVDRYDYDKIELMLQAYVA